MGCDGILWWDRQAHWVSAFVSTTALERIDKESRFWARERFVDVFVGMGSSLFVQAILPIEGPVVTAWQGRDLESRLQTS